MAKDSAMDKVNEARAAMANPDSGRVEDAADASDVRAVEHTDAQRVRDGELSAAQLEGGAANINPDYPDAQYPPGYVDTAAANRGDVLGGTDVAETLPEPGPATATAAETTDATPDYS